VTIEDDPLTTFAHGAGKALEELETVRPKRAGHRKQQLRIADDAP